MSLDALLKELREEYIQTFPDKIEKLRAYLETGDLENIELEFHKMKGTGKTYGFPEVTLLGQVMEDICQNHPEKLNEGVPLAVTLLEQFIETSGPGPMDIESAPEFTKLKTL